MKLVLLLDALRDYLPFGSGSLINRYKTGKVSTEDFTKGIRSYLWLSEAKLSDAAFKRCWNSMCTFSESAKNHLTDMNKLMVENPNFIIIAPSATNLMHHDYNLEQLRDLALGEKSELCKRVIYRNSYETGTQDLNRMLSEAIEVPAKDVRKVISFHTQVNPESLNLSGKHADIDFGSYPEEIKSPMRYMKIYIQQEIQDTPVRA